MFVVGRVVPRELHRHEPRPLPRLGRLSPYDALCCGHDLVHVPVVGAHVLVVVSTASTVNGYRVTHHGILINIYIYIYNLVQNVMNFIIDCNFINDMILYVA